MTDYAAFAVCSADSGARVFAFLVDARQMIWAFAVTDAFRAAIGWGSYKVWEARARRRLSNDFALGVKTARRRIARVCWELRSNFAYKFVCVKHSKSYKSKTRILRKMHSLIRI